MSPSIQLAARTTYDQFSEIIPTARRVSGAAGEFEIEAGDIIGSVRVRHAEDGSTINQIHLDRLEPLVVHWKKDEEWCWYVIPYRWLLERVLFRDQKPQHGIDSLICFSCSASQIPIEFEVSKDNLETRCISEITSCTNIGMRRCHQEIANAQRLAAARFENAKDSIKLILESL